MTRRSRYSLLRLGTNPTRAIRAPFVRAAIEQLEDRLAPAVLSFGTSKSFSGSVNNPGFVLSGDWNDDQNLDLVLTNYGDGTAAGAGQNITFLYGNGDGSFGGAITKAVGGTSDSVSYLAVGDLNGDEFEDIVTIQTNQSTEAGTVTVFKGSAVGSFTPIGPAVSSQGTRPWAVAIADMNGDTKQDVVITHIGSTALGGGGSIAVLKNDGSGNLSLLNEFDPPQEQGDNGVPMGLAVAKLDGDNTYDLAVTFASIAFIDEGESTEDQGLLKIYPGNGDGTFAEPGKYFTGGPFPGIVIAAEVDGLAGTDLVVANTGNPDQANGYAGFGTGSTVDLFRNDGGGSFGPAISNKIGLISAFMVGVEDMNLDGKQDIVAVSYGHPLYPLAGAQGAVVVYLQDKTTAGKFAADVDSPFTTKSNGAQSMVIGNFNGLASPDVVVVHEGNQVVSLLNTSVPAAATSTALEVAPTTSSTYGESITFTATVSTASGTPTGNVTFLNGTAVVGSATLVDVGGKQVATLVTAPNQLIAGAYSFTARYDGLAGVFNKSTSSPAIAFTVSKAKTTTTLEVTPANPVNPGSPINFVVTVAGPGAPEGFVRLYNGINEIAPPAKLASSGGAQKAVFVLNSIGMTPGDYSITAKYADNLNWLGDDSDPYTLTISNTPAANTTITISSAAPSPSFAGQEVLITARVTAVSGTPVGPVQFFADGKLLGVGNLAPGFGGQEATFKVSSLGIGAHTFTANYVGASGVFNPSQSAAVGHTVNAIVTSVFLSTSGSPTFVTQPITFTALVGSQFGPANGTVTFWDGGVQIGSGSLAPVGGQQVATFIGVLGEGAHAVTAKFAAQGNFGESTSAPVTQQVNKVGSSTTISTNFNPAEEGQAITLFATVAGLVPIGALPSGAVTFFDGDTAIGTGTMANGVATLVVTLAPGTHAITAGFAGDVNFTASNSAAVSQVVNATVPPPPPPTGPLPTLIGFREFSVGAGAGMPAVARFFNPDGSERFNLNLFPGLTGGVRVTSADFNGDGVADMVAGTGPGSASQLRVLDGKSRNELFRVDPFEPAFVGGIYVASGDVTGDGVPDIVVSPDEGGGPRIQVYSGNGFVKVDDFFGIDDPNFRGGARAGIGDLDGDGVGDLVVSAGFGGGPRIAAFDGLTLGGNSRLKLFADFFAFESELRNGAFVAAGDLDGDGRADLFAGGGPGGGPRITAFSGQQLGANRAVPIANFFGGDVNNRGGVRVATRNLDGDDLTDLVIGAGTDAGSRVTGYAGKTMRVSSPPPELFAFDAYPGFTGGVYVG